MSDALVVGAVVVSMAVTIDDVVASMLESTVKQ